MRFKLFTNQVSSVLALAYIFATQPFDVAVAYAKEHTSAASTTMAVDQKKNEVAYLMAASRLSRDGLHKMAFLIASDAAIARTVEVEMQPFGNHSGRDQVWAKQYRESATASAEAFVDGKDFRDGYIEAGLKDALEGASFIPVYGKFIPKNVAGKAIGDLLDIVGTPGQTPMLTKQDTLNYVAWALTAAQNPKDPYHDRAAQLASKYLQVNPNLPYEFDPAVIGAQKQNLIEKLLRDAGISEEKIQQQLKETKKGVDGLKKLISDQAEANFQKLQQAAEEAKAHEENLKYARMAQDVADGLNALSLAASMLGDKEAVPFLQKSTALAGGMQKMFALKDDAKAGVFAYANAYMTVFSLASQLLMSQSQDDGTQLIFEQLREISQQIEDLHRDMTSRFNDLDRRLTIDFDRVHLQLDNIQASTNEIEALARKQIEISEQISQTVGWGFRLQQMQYLAGLKQSCLGVDRRRKVFPVDDQKALNCRSQFSLLAVGQNDQNVNGGASEGGRISANDWHALATYLNAQGAWTQTGVFPGNWLYGSMLLNEFYQKHPQYKRDAYNSRPDEASYSLAEVIRTGENVSIDLKSMALKPNGAGYSFRTDQALGLLQAYSREVSDKLSLAMGRDRANGGEGPRPGMGWADALPLDNNYSFLRSGTPLPLCNDTPARLTYADSGQYMSMNPQWLRLTAGFVPVLPKSVLWADREKFLGTQVSLCLRTMEVNRNGLRGFDRTSTGGGIWMGASYHIVIEANATTNDGKKYPLGSLVASDLVSIELFRLEFAQEKDPSANPRYNQVYHIWNGYYDDTVGADGTTKYVPVAVNPSLYFKFDPQGTSGLQEFESIYGKELAARKIQYQRVFQANLTANAGVGSERKLGLLIMLGINPVDSDARDLAEQLLRGELLPSPETIATLAYEKGLSVEVASQLVEQRIAAVTERLNKLGVSTSLLPRTAEYDLALARLKSIR